jgi:hypothetical protein
MTRRDFAERLGSMCALVFSGFAIGRLHAIGHNLSEWQPPIDQSLSEPVWDSQPEFIFHRANESVMDGVVYPHSALVAWKATFGTARFVIRKKDGSVTMTSEPAQYGDFRALSSDNPPLAEMLDCLHQFDKDQRALLAKLAKKAE